MKKKKYRYLLYIVSRFSRLIIKSGKSTLLSAKNNLINDNNDFLSRRHSVGTPYIRSTCKTIFHLASLFRFDPVSPHKYDPIYDYLFVKKHSQFRVSSNVLHNLRVTRSYNVVPPIVNACEMKR